jgi:hypothetical protein
MVSQPQASLGRPQYIGVQGINPSIRIMGRYSICYNYIFTDLTPDAVPPPSKTVHRSQSLKTASVFRFFTLQITSVQ